MSMPEAAEFGQRTAQEQKEQAEHHGDSCVKAWRDVAVEVAGLVDMRLLDVSADTQGQCAH